MQHAKIAQPTKFIAAPISWHFLFFFPYGFWSTMLSLDRLVCAWIDSTILASIACKNYKI